MIKKIFYSNFFILNFFITRQFCINFNTFITNLNLNKSLFIMIKNDFKYSWSNQYQIEDTSFNLQFINLNSLRFNNNYNNQNITNSVNILNDIIFLKKKTSLVKKNINIGKFLITKINNNKYNFDIISSEISQNYSEDFDIFTNFNKNLDMNNKIKLLLKNNRLFIKYFFNLKEYRAFSLNKRLKKICNFKKSDLINILENNLLNVLMKVDFFFSKSDCIWFLKNSLISVNSNIIKNKFFLLNPCDIINLPNTKYYYYFYKNKFSNLLLNINKINNKFWSINKNKINSFELEPFNYEYPKWVNNYQFFKSDIPLNLEVDYISMTIILLNLPFNLKNYDSFNLKYINLYLNRLYNWKYII